MTLFNLSRSPSGVTHACRARVENASGVAFGARLEPGEGPLECPVKKDVSDCLVAIIVPSKGHFDLLFSFFLCTGLHG